MSLDEATSTSTPPSRPYTPDYPATSFDSTLSSFHHHSPLHIREVELQARAEAEERGEAYAAQVADKVQYMDNIGDLKEDILDKDPDNSTTIGDSDLLQDDQPQVPVPHAQRAPNIHVIRDSLPIHTVPDANPRHPGKNSPDPFLVLQSSASLPSIKLTNTYGPLYMIYLLVVWLHTQFQLAWLACNAVLVVTSNILVAAGLVPAVGPGAPYGTLTLVINNLGVEPSFWVLPVCPSCMEPHPASQAPDSVCQRCLMPLFEH
jgi:hypothetical protein